MIGPDHVGVALVAEAPVRVGDVGGWTDTWFGSPGRVCHLAVGPGVSASAEVRAVGSGELGGAIRLLAPDVGVTVVVDPSLPPDRRPADPLLEHAARAGLGEAALASEVVVEVAVRSAVPAGASLGTSAAVLVAVVGALDALTARTLGRPPLDLAAVARLAHEVETVRAGREAGVQDQWAAALGGAGLLAIGPYPDVRREAVPLTPSVVDELGERLITVVFGPHDSSAVHRQVIDAFITCSGVEHHEAREALKLLSRLAGEAAAALGAGDVDAWADVLAASVDGQAALHPGLVGAPHRRAIEVARTLGARGWKVNGAGGDGGSLTVVAGADPGAAEVLADALAEAGGSGWQVLRLRPSVDGLRVTPR